MAEQAAQTGIKIPTRYREIKVIRGNEREARRVIKQNDGKVVLIDDAQQNSDGLNLLAHVYMLGIVRFDEQDRERYHFSQLSAEDRHAKDERKLYYEDLESVLVAAQLDAAQIEI